MGNCLVVRRRNPKIEMTLLYDNGDKCTSVTGGWTGYSSSGNYEDKSTYLHYGKFSQGVGTGGYQTTNKINLKNYKYVWFEGYSTTNEGGGSSYAYFKALSGTTEICDFCLNCPHYQSLRILLPITSTSNAIFKVQGSSSYAYTKFEVLMYKLALVKQLEV